MGAELFLADGRTDGHDEVNNPISQFCERAWKFLSDLIVVFLGMESRYLVGDTKFQKKHSTVLKTLAVSSSETSITNNQCDDTKAMLWICSAVRPSCPISVISYRVNMKRLHKSLLLAWDSCPEQSFVCPRNTSHWHHLHTAVCNVIKLFNFIYFFSFFLAHSFLFFVPYFCCSVPSPTSRYLLFFLFFIFLFLHTLTTVLSKY